MWNEGSLLKLMWKMLLRSAQQKINQFQQ